MKKVDLLILIIASFILSAVFAGSGVGASSYCGNSDCNVSASSSFISIVISMVMLALITRYSQINSDEVTSIPVRLRRRLAAFIIDFFVILVITIPLSALVFLVIESAYTDLFQWSFSRKFARPTDTPVLVVTIFGVYFLMFYYFYKHLRINRQTAGQYILGYKIINDLDEIRNPRYGRRVLYSFIGLCTWPVTLVHSYNNPKKIMWWDKSTFTRAVRVNEEVGE